jgi:hypothetical protein
LRSGVHFLRPSCMQMPNCSSLMATSACWKAFSGWEDHINRNSCIFAPLIL